jgi:hypothetical protein
VIGRTKVGNESCWCSRHGCSCVVDGCRNEVKLLRAGSRAFVARRSSHLGGDRVATIIGTSHWEEVGVIAIATAGCSLGNWCLTVQERSCVAWACRV